MNVFPGLIWTDLQSNKQSAWLWTVIALLREFFPSNFYMNIVRMHNTEAIALDYWILEFVLFRTILPIIFLRYLILHIMLSMQLWTSQISTMSILNEEKLIKYGYTHDYYGIMHIKLTDMQFN